MREAKDKADLPERIRAEIERQGLTGYALSRASGVDQSTVYRFLRGECDLSLANAGLLLDAIGAQVVFASGEPKKKRRAAKRKASKAK